MIQRNFAEKLSIIGDGTATQELEWIAPSQSISYQSQKSTTRGTSQPTIPDWQELQAYFDHCDKVCNLSKDTAFETVVTSAEFDEEAGKWTVKTADGRTAKTRFLIIAAGFAAKRYIPDYKSMDKFKGVIHHSSFWPPEDVNVKGKRVAVVGTGM
jgi:cation diffusion facilitator CzcD-associated flavoprotein CzcO